MHDERSLLPIHDPRRADRVRRRTAPDVLAEIDRRTATRVMRVARGGHDAIAARIEELDREWDLDRWFVVLFTVGSALVEQRGRHGGVWRLLFRAQQLMALGYGLFGWAPPVSLLRRVGIRTQKEIDAERAVLVELLRLMEADLDEAEESFVVIEEAQIVHDPATATR